MYKLYGYVDNERYGRKLEKIKECEDEFEIIKTIDEDIKTTEIIHYFIVKRENNTDSYYLSINCYEDFIDYIDYYRKFKGVENERRQRKRD